MEVWTMEYDLTVGSCVGFGHWYTQADKDAVVNDLQVQGWITEPLVHKDGEVLGVRIVGRIA
jgi:hypothetical protein